MRLLDFSLEKHHFFHHWRHFSPPLLPFLQQLSFLVKLFYDCFFEKQAANFIVNHFILYSKTFSVVVDFAFFIYSCVWGSAQTHYSGLSLMSCCYYHLQMTNFLLAYSWFGLHWYTREQLLLPRIMRASSINRS